MSGIGTPAIPSSGGGSTITNLIGATALGQATMATSLPVVLPSDQAAIPVTLTSTTITGSVAVTNAGTFAVQADTELPAAATLADGLDNPSTSSIAALGYVYTSTGDEWNRLKQTSSTLNTTSTGIPAIAAVAQFDDSSPTTISENQFGNLRMSTRRELYGQIRDAAGNERGANVSANNSLQVTQKSSTATLSNVASSATNVTILASNTARTGATVYNDSTQILYLKFGTTASTTSFTVKLASETYYEVPGGYTGVLDGLWASANGSARITELT